jgi:hypothetical protein
VTIRKDDNPGEFRSALTVEGNRRREMDSKGEKMTKKRKRQKAKKKNTRKRRIEGKRKRKFPWQIGQLFSTFFLSSV